MKLALVLLNRNEITGLTALWDRIPFGAADEAFVVDGGSTDGSLEFFAQKGFPVVQQVSRGRGEAFRLAFEHSKADVLLFYSPDGNEDPADIPRFRPLLEAGADMVIASRMMRGAWNEEDEHWFRPRKWANNAFNAIVAAFMADPDLQSPVEAVTNINAIVDGRRANLGTLIQKGVDLSIGYAFESSIGDWRVGLDASQIIL